MDLTTCSVYLVAGSAGAATGFCLGSRRPGRRAARVARRRATMRDWPGRVRGERAGGPDGPR